MCHSFTQTLGRGGASHKLQVTLSAGGGTLKKRTGPYANVYGILELAVLEKAKDKQLLLHWGFKASF